jgi:hypothetical protein
MSDQKPMEVVIRVQKTAATAFLLAFFFGPLGMLYSTVPGAFIMMIITLLIAIPTVGFGLFITQPICIIWAVMAVNSLNKKAVTN